jgi:S-adenosylmethionine hydrolase
MITLASDFGSPYPAAMKGVVCRRSDARLVDVTHDLPRGDVRAAAFWLRFVLPEFPPAVHLAVVDPGVGTDRDALVVRAGNHLLVGPDNGLLLPAARALADAGPDATLDGAGTDAPPPEVGPTPHPDPDPGPDAAPDIAYYVVDPGDPASTTFHGRDVFAPAAAAVHGAVTGGGDGDTDMDADAWNPEAVAAVDGVTPAAEVVDVRFPTPILEADRAVGEVLVVDGFGNAITNLPGEAVADRSAAVVDGRRVPVVDTFAAVDPGDPLVTVGSHGNVELDVNDGRGADWFGVAPGDAVDLRLVE